MELVYDWLQNKDKRNDKDASGRSEDDRIFE